MTRISAAFAVQDEAHHIGAALASVSFCDEIVVVDGGSRDATVEIARRAGARVIEHPSSDGGIHANKNRAIAAATGDWILSLDADERVPEALAEDIREALRLSEASGSTGPHAYRISRRTYWGKNWVKSCGWWPSETIRLFRKGATQWPLEVHRVPVHAGPTGRLKTPLEHFSVKDWGDWLRKVRHFSGCEAVEMHRAGRRVSFFRDILLAPKITFLRKYLLQGGWREGRIGLYVSFSAALAVFFKYARLAEIEAGGERPDLGERDRPE